MKVIDDNKSENNKVQDVKERELQPCVCCIDGSMTHLQLLNQTNVVKPDKCC